MVLDVLNDGTDAGTEVGWRNLVPDKIGQQWEIGGKRGKYFTIKNPASGKLLTAVEGNLNLTIEGTYLKIYVHK